MYEESHLFETKEKETCEVQTVRIFNQHYLYFISCCSIRRENKLHLFKQEIDTNSHRRNQINFTNERFFILIEISFSKQNKDVNTQRRTKKETENESGVKAE